MSELKINDARLIEAEQHHHIVIMTNLECREFPMAIGFANADNEILHFVALDMHTANQLGDSFCEKYNETLRKLRGDT